MAKKGKKQLCLGGNCHRPVWNSKTLPARRSAKQVLVLQDVPPMPRQELRLRVDARERVVLGNEAVVAVMFDTGTHKIGPDPRAQCQFPCSAQHNEPNIPFVHEGTSVFWTSNGEKGMYACMYE
jgi:hypothetical protein